MAIAEDHDQRDKRFDVLIAGAGIAGLESAFALRELLGDRVGLRLLAPNAEFVYRPLSIGEPFSRSHAEHYSLARLAAQADAELVTDSLAEVDVERRVARTVSGAELGYDALIVAVGAGLEYPYEHATRFDDARSDELLHGLVQDIEAGYVGRLAIVIPAPMPWPLPAYELALMASERAWDSQISMDVTVLTSEAAPLAAFGELVSGELSALLAERRIEVITSAYCEIPRSKKIVVSPGGGCLEADRIVAFPRLEGPRVPGLPCDGGGFIPVDEYARVRRADRVWAAGDAADFPVKQGGIAAQLADTAARSIAVVAGGSFDARTFAPVLEGVLMTGGRPRYLRGYPTFPGHPTFPRSREDSVFTAVAPGSAPPKIAARYLGPHLEANMSAAVSTD